jgi:anti-sigma regulatory factor (Ser/Thr protein kinase)
MPDDEAIRLTLPPDPHLASVASIAVRAAARQIALPETEIDRLRAAVVESFTAHATASDEPIELVFHPAAGHMTIEVGATVIE